MSRRKQPNPNKVQRKSASFSPSLPLAAPARPRAARRVFAAVLGETWGLFAAVGGKFARRRGDFFLSPLRVAS